MHHYETLKQTLSEKESAAGTPTMTFAIPLNASLHSSTFPLVPPPAGVPEPKLSASSLQIGERVITEVEMLPLLVRYRLLPQFLREVILDQAIVAFACTDEDIVAAAKQFYAQQQIKTDSDLQTWLSCNHLTLNQIEEILNRTIRIGKFKQATWEHKLESYFLQRKGKLDRVIYSLIRLKDEQLAQELYFRIQEGEQSLATLAQQYSDGSEAQTGGLIGPTELSKPHPLLAQKLAASQPGQLLPPMRLEDWVVLVRLEKFLPCQLDDAMRQRLLNELFEAWITEQLRAITL
jgi:parvulin-like peptidyl-prolyl isomerase